MLPFRFLSCGSILPPLSMEPEREFLQEENGLPGPPENQVPWQLVGGELGTNPPNTNLNSPNHETLIFLTPKCNPRLFGVQPRNVTGQPLGFCLYGVTAAAFVKGRGFASLTLLLWLGREPVDDIFSPWAGYPSIHLRMEEIYFAPLQTMGNHCLLVFAGESSFHG